MRASLVGSLLLMLFLLQEAQGIYADDMINHGFDWKRGFMHTQVGAQKFQADHLGEEAIPCKEGHCRGTMEKRVSRSVLSKKSSRQWSPRIHEDYCGPRHHKPRHH
ncbi:hypothetical protein OIU84_011459 [Salix udensis]|uniref:Uncharacterized protein n=1 Tax=Salix udensis TaxID=889485 RepID=A0AAD6JNE4_9ROSI|nr:hypothetical protein OIU84_011459 [Salix udensis]